MNTLAVLCLVLAGFLWAGAGMSFLNWIGDLDARSVWNASSWTTNSPARVQSRFTGRRANYIPRAGQVWRSSDPRRLSAFRIVHVDIPRGYVIDPDNFFYGWANDWEGCKASVEMITHPGAIGKTARRIPVNQFQVLGSKGYTRIS